MFSYLSLSSISSATVTPSLVTVGAPHPLSMTALRPRGPSVVFTARASFETPDSSALRASISKASILAAMPDLLSEEAVVSCLLLVVVVGNALTHRPTARPRVSPEDEPSAHEAACQTVCPNGMCAQVTMPQATMRALPNAPRLSAWQEPASPVARRLPLWQENTPCPGGYASLRSGGPSAVFAWLGPRPQIF